MIDATDRVRRAEQFRSWYDTLPTASDKSGMKRKIIMELNIGAQSFYDLLSGRVYLSRWKRCEIERIIRKEIFV